MMFSVFNIETLIFKINRIDFSDKINYICDKNGSGKTLFLDSLYFDNKVRIEPHIDKKDIIYLSQHFSFYERIKVKDFIEFFDQINNENLLEKTRKNSYINNFINENFDKTLYHLSGGEFKFLYLILLLFTDKKLYLLDEPFNELDKEKAKYISNLIKDLNKNGKKIIITNHYDLGLFEEKDMKKIRLLDHTV